ncbi:MAG TPA: prepilin-type N-terminal cleavage/methylation domain-containing protein [Terriglobia bacterium]|nr:prepilin-type N-terminal cleavage/methylation domain-containing protein [Terriglobia bacterium]
MNSKNRLNEKGFTLMEVMIAGLIMTISLLALAYAYGQGFAVVVAGQQKATAQQQARAAMEDLLAARNTGLLQFSQIDNVSNGGVFLSGAQPLTAPNPQGVLGTATDALLTPAVPGYTRQIQITDLSSTLKQVTVTVLYTTPSGASPSSATNCSVGCYQITSDVYQSTN